jgi:hypothetical protein
MRAVRPQVLWLVLTYSGFAAAPTAEIDSITLERTWCNGTCPIYTVTVRRDGTVTYDGEEYVKVRGHRSRRISSEQFQKLVREIQRIGFFKLKDEYMSKEHPDGSFETVTDLPSAITTVRAGKTRKRIRNYYGGPESLAGFENLIDKVAGSSAWTGNPQPVIH